MKVSVVHIVFILIQVYDTVNSELNFDEKVLLNRSIASPASDDYYRLSNYDFQCFRQLSICSTNGWSLKFRFRLNQLTAVDRERRFLLFSTGAHEPFGDGMLIYLHQSKNTSYLEFGLKEFRNDQFAYYWQIEVELEINRWIDAVTTIQEHVTKTGKHHRMALYFDGFPYKETQVENYTEVFVFKYSQVHPRSAVIYGTGSGIALFDKIVYYERVLTDEEISEGSIFFCFIFYAEQKNKRFLFSFTGKCSLRMYKTE